MTGDDLRPHRRGCAAALLACQLFLSGLVMVVHGGTIAGPVGPATEFAEPPAVPGFWHGSPTSLAPPTGLPRSPPIHLDIPAIDVHTPLMPLGLNADSTMAMPPLTRTAPAGWYRYFATPGEIGTALIAGHVDSARFGPAVFFRLGRLRTGDAVTVRRADGRKAEFAVVAVLRYAKSRFPADAVYAPAFYPALRLMTCGGTFDRRRGHYRDLVVVYAVAVPRQQGTDDPPVVTRNDR